jgi:hypothetical protein
VRLLTTLCTYPTTHRSLGNITQHEPAYGDVPDVSNIRVFGCAVFSTFPHAKKSGNKAARATNLGHIGYGKYRLLLPGPEYKIFIATSVKFDEEVFDNAADVAKEETGISNAAGGDDIISNAKPLLDSDDVNEDEDESVANHNAVPQVASVNTQDMPNQDDDAQGQEVDETRRYPSRTRTQTRAWLLTARTTRTSDTPTVTFALASPDKNKWLEAIDKESSAQENQGTWTMVPHQPGLNILRSHLVLKAKRDTAGAIIKYKARLVAGGDTQVHGLDFDKS